MQPPDGIIPRAAGAAGQDEHVRRQALMREGLGDGEADAAVGAGDEDRSAHGFFCG